jgi:hypothetical protein
MWQDLLCTFELRGDVEAELVTVARDYGFGMSGRRLLIAWNERARQKLEEITTAAGKLWNPEIFTNAPTTSSAIAVR